MIFRNDLYPTRAETHFDPPAALLKPTLMNQKATHMLKSARAPTRAPRQILHDVRDAYSFLAHAEVFESSPPPPPHGFSLHVNQHLQKDPTLRPSAG